MSQPGRVKKARSKLPAGAKPSDPQSPQPAPGKKPGKSLFQGIKDGSAWNEDEMLPLLPPGERARLRTRLREIVGDPQDFSPPDSSEGQAVVSSAVEAILAEEVIVLAEDERLKLISQLGAEWIGLGPLQPLMDDKEVWAIFVYGPDNVYAVLPQWALHRVAVRFEDEAHLTRIIRRMASSAGQRLDEDHPTAYFRPPDRTLVTVFMPPLSVSGPSLSILKIRMGVWTVQFLIDSGAASVPEMEFLRACVIAGLRILVCGQNGVGKTALMNLLGGFIPQPEQIVVLEQYDELVLSQSAVQHLVYGGPGAERGYSLNNLLWMVAHAYPERIIFSEVQGAEALAVLGLLIGRGSLVDIKATSPEHALKRFEQLCLLTEGIDPGNLRRQLAEMIDLVVHVERLVDRHSKITRISEVQGVEGDLIQLADLFRFEETGQDQVGRIEGVHKALGAKPGKRIMSAIDYVGIKLPDHIFGIS